MNCEFQTIDETHSTHGEQISHWRERSVDVDLGLLHIARGKAHQRSFRMNICLLFQDCAPEIFQSCIHLFRFTTLTREPCLESIEILVTNGGFATRRDNDVIRLQRGDVGWRVEA